MNTKPLPALVLIALTSFHLPVADAVEAGEPAPQFTLPTLKTAKPVTLSAYAGKVVYLDFWASWCAPCRTSFPLLDKLHQELQAQGFEVVAVNLDEDPAKAEQFLAEFRVGFTVLRDEQGVWADRYVVESMPTSFIIDKQGVVRHVHHGFSSDDINGLKQTVVQLLAAE